jgi:hypothetical protein
VDWDNKSDTFDNEWQTYRTREDNTLALETNHTYADPGEYAVVVMDKSGGGSQERHRKISRTA